jgi:hypothetical protein
MDLVMSYGIAPLKAILPKKDYEKNDHAGDKTVMKAYATR